MTSCLLRIHSLRFFDGGLHEVPVEEVMTVALIAIFIFVPCLWLVRYLKEYAYLDIDRRKLMLIVAKERGKWLLLLWALGFSTVGRFCIYLFPAVWGVIGTLFLAQAFAGMGIAGIGLGLLFQVPQILIYVPLFLWMMEEADKKSRQFAYLRKIGTAGKNNRRYFLCFFVALSVLFLGILTESYAGSGLVQMILRIVY